MRSPQTTGVAPAWPGSGSRQATFCVRLHRIGTFFSLEMPLLVGPRQLGQFSARAADDIRASRHNKTTDGRACFTAGHSLGWNITWLVG